MSVRQVYVALQGAPHFSPEQSRKERAIEIKRATREAAVNFLGWLQTRDANAIIDPPIGEETFGGLKVTAQQEVVEQLLRETERPVMVASVAEVGRWEARGAQEVKYT